MIRWWDYIVVFLYADIMAGFLLTGFTATEWYVPLVSGAVVAVLWNNWHGFYCQWRLHYEESQQ